MSGTDANFHPHPPDLSGPRHIAIIMDGNGRWARSKGLARHAGHRAGASAVRLVVEECVRLGIPVLTLFAFSSENWKRPKEEVSLLMDLFMNMLQREVRKLDRNQVRLRIIGDRSAFSPKLQEQIAKAEEKTSENTGLVLQIAANYGGRWDITEAVRRIGLKIQARMLRPEQVTEEVLAGELSFAGLPDPDLYIRTGGEQRLSNFVLWQAAYSELYFSGMLWPDFDAAALARALQAYANRRRRFGLTDDQLKSAPLPPRC